MNTNKSKMSWNGSVWTLSSGDGTGTSIAHSMTTVTRVLSALTMAGFAVSQVVQEDTSIALQGVKFAQDTARKQFLALNKPMQTGQTSGSAWTHYNPTSREYHTAYSTNWDGEHSLEDLESQAESLYHTLARTEAELSSSRYDTLTEVSDALHSLQAARRHYMERNASESLRNTCASQREAETRSSSECVESQQSQSHQPQAVTYYGSSQGFVSSEEPYSWQSAIETGQEINSSITYEDVPF